MGDSKSDQRRQDTKPENLLNSLNFQAENTTKNTKKSHKPQTQKTKHVQIHHLSSHPIPAFHLLRRRRRRTRLDFRSLVPAIRFNNLQRRYVYDQLRLQLASSFCSWKTFILPS